MFPISRNAAVLKIRAVAIAVLRCGPIIAVIGEPRTANLIKTVISVFVRKIPINRETRKIKFIAVNSRRSLIAQANP